MDKPVLAPELRTMSFVTRWNILWRINKTNIAEHSFFVAWYVFTIANLIEWKGNTLYAVMKGLEHDLDETITADIVGPARRVIVDKDTAAEWLEAKQEIRMGGLLRPFIAMENTVEDGEYAEAQKIVRAADLLDAVLCLLVEQEMGNRRVDYAYNSNLKLFEGAWRDLPADKMVLDRLWNVEIFPAIEAHRSVGGNGVGL